MNRTAVPLRAGALAIAVALSGCQVLKTPDPVQLYRFGGGAGAPAEAAARGDRPAIRIALITGAFPRAAAGNRILTVSGVQAAYLADARWVTAATQLFEEAVLTAFDRAPPNVGLNARGDATDADALLRLDVDRFEASYDQGEGAPPTAVVQLSAKLIRRQDRTVIGERTFDTRVPAAEDRVGPVISALDQATNQALSGVVQWSADTARAAGLDRPTT